MKLALLYRLIIPLLLTLLSASVFFRGLILVALVIASVGLLVAASRLAGRNSVKTAQTTKAGKKFIDGNYTIVDENHEPSK
jgi:hypothetical protein